MPIRFRCPQCHALMQVADQAAGYRTECPGCQSVCEVPKTSTDPGPPSDRNRPVAAPTPSVRPVVATSQQAPQPVTKSAAGSIVQLRCPSCQQLMRAAKGATVKCPHCASTVRAPGSPPSGSEHYANLGGQPQRSGQTPQPDLDSEWNRLPSSSAHPGQLHPNPYRANPYAGAAIGGGYRAAQPGDRSWQYVLLGIIFILASLPAFLGTILNIIGAGMTLSGMRGNLPPEQTAVSVGVAIGSLVISLPLGIMYLIGGIAFLRRQSLTSAQIVSVVACIPCLNYLILTPFGIWAAIIIFSDEARKDFDN